MVFIAHLCSPAHLKKTHFCKKPVIGGRVKSQTRSPAHLLTCSPAHLLTCSPAHLLTCSPAHLLTCSPHIENQ